MTIYKTLEDGALSSDTASYIPTTHRFYRQALEEVEAGESTIEPYVEPEPTQEQLDAAAKLSGVEFEGVMCSATSEDMWGLASVKDWIAAGNSTNFIFKNGNTLLLTPTNVSAFEAVWVPFRQSFFSPE